ncbi:hypothetical protein Ancab_017305 [Ancistrocladus abbreviatus]
MKAAAALTSTSDHQLPPLKSRVKSFHTPNGLTSTASTSSGNSTFYPTTSDVELVVLRPVTYTSLKDITPSSPPSQQGVLTPPASGGTRKNSWDDVAIKNPLVKQAAIAYLQPMSTPPVMGDRNWLQRLKDKFCFGRDDEEVNQLGCLGFANHVVFVPIRGILCRAIGISSSSTDEQSQHLE